MKEANAGAANGGLSAKSMIKAKSIAASILNMSENDLADILDTNQVTPRDRGSTQTLTCEDLYQVEIKPSALDIPTMDFLFCKMSKHPKRFHRSGDCTRETGEKLHYIY